MLAESPRLGNCLRCLIGLARTDNQLLANCERQGDSTSAPFLFTMRMLELAKEKEMNVVHGTVTDVHLDGSAGDEAVMGVTYTDSRTETTVEFFCRMSL